MDKALDRQIETFLLNVGPDTHGSIPEDSLPKLHSIGKLLKPNQQTMDATFHGPPDGTRSS